MYPVTNLMRGTPFLLDQSVNGLLASFLCLASMRLEKGGRDTKAIPDSDIGYLKANFEPPPGWKIWITQYAGNVSDQFGVFQCRFDSAYLTRRPSAPDTINEQVSTFVAGRLCAHLFSSRMRHDFLGYEGILQTQIWPPASFDARFSPDTWRDMGGCKRPARSHRQGRQSSRRNMEIAQLSRGG